MNYMFSYLSPWELGDLRQSSKLTTANSYSLSILLFSTLIKQVSSFRFSCTQSLQYFVEISILKKILFVELFYLVSRFYLVEKRKLNEFKPHWISLDILGSFGVGHHVLLRKQIAASILVSLQSGTLVAKVGAADESKVKFL